MASAPSGLGGALLSPGASTPRGLTSPTGNRWCGRVQSPGPDLIPADGAVSRHGVGQGDRTGQYGPSQSQVTPFSANARTIAGSSRKS
jgi:hypothetical protein